MDILAGDLFALTADKGLKKTQTSLWHTFLLSCLAGIYIGLGYIAYLKVVSSVDGPYTSLIGASLFPLGLTLVIVAGAQLFTGNCMDVFMAYISKQISLKALIKNWALVFFGNFVGSFLLAFIYGEGLGFTQSLLASGELETIINGKISATPLQMIISGIFCNILVCLGVWLANSSKSNGHKMLLLWMPVTIFVYLGLQHSVANMFLLSAGLFAGVNSISELVINLVLVGLGNIIGGAFVVGGIYGQVYQK
ncbi:formate/nitrite transporter family protein [Aerococcus agrisoli]|uniref:Formate/nitrite transporter family protein n=1 Tax=Aerococcus agrisoli TaxID=2487350 RepID=A0A3N4GP36_9LACT|nr:formate/nitrite transporter family protein [Aerococcus agrisoli]RPA62406.1 formate/nitrite transporter family protein [Aerococcus agrisoli]